VLAEDLKLRIKSLCPEVRSAEFDDFFDRMDPDYFTTFEPEEIATHIRMSAGLDSRHRVRVRVTSTRSREFEIVIVGFDYLSEFSIFCGLLSAFGLDIESGNIYSFAKLTDRRSRPRKIVDVFNVALKSGEVFDEVKQREFEQELQTLAEFLATGSVDRARERLNRFLTERIEKMNESLSDLARPIEMEFDNDTTPQWTVMKARSGNAFALLYAISNALSMQGIYIHNVKIRSVDREARDEFFIADKWGRKIEEQDRQERLRTAVAMIKQFTSFLPEAPDPAKAMVHFDQFLDKVAAEESPVRVMRFLSQPEGMNLLAHLLGSSDYLWDDFLGVHFPNLLPLLEGLSTKNIFPTVSKGALRAALRDHIGRAGTAEGKIAAIKRFRDDQVFLIDAYHLVDPRATLIDFSEALTSLAEAIIEEAVALCLETGGGGDGGAFAVCGLGKFGGRELGYASDLELIFVHEAQDITANTFFESIARRVIEIVEGPNERIFQIDLRLRPYGDAGAWSIPLEEFRRYYSPAGSAAPFERQALIKLRWVAGDEPLGRAVEAHRDSFTYSGAAWDWKNALHLRRRQIRELVKPGETNVKYSAGGLIDIEYTAQYLQLLHGKDHPELRIPSTLRALEELRRLQIVTAPEYRILEPGYLFLRNLIDALRIVRGDPSDLLLPDKASDDFKSLARRLGYRELDRFLAASHLAADIHDWMERVEGVFVGRFGKEKI
jgi:[glutamine synthetase] adenylyltransferase / [glutamine synthetase]-adenylyl-L-tyrosine phosphorylase